MTIDVMSILTLGALTIILGYIGNSFYKKTKIPDLIWLILLGIFIGPIFGLIDIQMFVAVSPLLAAIALIVILFDAGLNMNFYQFLREFPRAFVVTLLGIVSSIIIIGYVSVFMFKFDLTTGLLLGSIICGTCTPTVLSIMEKLKIRWDVKTILNLESVINDPFGIIIFFAILNWVTLSETNIIKSITISFSVGALLGLIAGIVWLIILTKIQRKKFDYILTMGVIILLYVIIESLGGSGVISALIFGLVLGNNKLFTRFFRFKEELIIGKMLKRFHSEISFFFSSFFFVLLGLILIIDLNYVIYAIVISIILIAIRYFTMLIGTTGMNLSKNDLDLMRYVGPRGLTAAILAQIPLALGIEGGEIILTVTFVVIIATVIFSTYWIRFKYQPE